jgi:hypothetical protein
MLRITIDQVGSTTILRLEGWLEGQYVAELRRCWNDVPEEQRIIVELADIRFVAPAGRALLVEMVQASAEIVACDALTRGIRDDVTATAGHRN